MEEKNYIETPESKEAFERFLLEGSTKEDTEKYDMICNIENAPKTYHGFNVIYSNELPVNYAALVLKTEHNGKA